MGAGQLMILSDDMIRTADADVSHLHESLEHPIHVYYREKSSCLRLGFFIQP